MRLVTNTSPLIFLTKIDALALLPRCFSEILAPAAVLAEVGLELPDFILRSELSELGQAYVRGAIGRLHRGELEAMGLANTDMNEAETSASGAFMQRPYL